MNYKNGRVIRVGDNIVARNPQGHAMMGVVVGAAPGDTETLVVAPASSIVTVPANEAVHLEDAMNPAPYKEPELNLVPPGKPSPEAPPPEHEEQPEPGNPGDPPPPSAE